MLLRVLRVRMQRLFIGLYFVVIICHANAFLPQERRRTSVALAFLKHISPISPACSFPELPSRRRPIIKKLPVSVTNQQCFSFARKFLQLAKRNMNVLSNVASSFFVREPPIPRTLFQALKVFFGSIYHGPRIIAICLAGLVIGRRMLNTKFSLSEVGIAISVVFFWCLQEHVLHQRLLHSETDWPGKRIHQEHHDRDYFHVSIDPALRMISWLSMAGIVLFCLMPTTELAMTATIAYTSAGLWYEWTHFIVHTRVRFPKHSYFDICKTHHARHHLVSSDHWFAFSYPAVDNWWGTNPSSVKAVRKNKAIVRTDEVDGDGDE